MYVDKKDIVSCILHWCTRKNWDLVYHHFPLALKPSWVSSVDQSYKCVRIISGETDPTHKTIYLMLLTSPNAKCYCSEEIQSTYYRITWHAQSDVMVLTRTSGEGGRSRHCMERSKLNPNSLLATVFSSSGIAGHLERYILIQKTQNSLI